MVIVKALIVWLLICAAEIAHGILRMRFLAPRVGKTRSDQIGVFTGSLIILTIVWLLFPWLSASQKFEQVLIGLAWTIGMLCFEFGFGRWYLRLPWDRLTEAYDPRRGGRMLLGMAFLAASPCLVAWLRSGL